MITFIPSWNYIANQNISSDELIGQIRSFMNTEENYQTFISNYMPNLRYFLHRYDLLESNYWNLFDELQDSEGFEQRSINLKDLHLDEKTSFFYTPYNILGWRNDELSERIQFGAGATITAVKHYKNAMLTHIDVYDDRGFLSSQEIYSEGNLDYIMYFNIKGNWIIKEYKQQRVVEVNSKLKKFDKLTYDSLEDVIQECLDKKVTQLPQNSSVIISVTDNNFKRILTSKFKSQMTLSFFANRFNFNNYSDSDLEQLFSSTNSVIVDTDHNLERVQKVSKRTNDIYKVSPYDARFEFGASETLKEEIVYFDGRDIDDESMSEVVKILLKLIYTGVSRKENEREVHMKIRVNNDKEALLNSMIKSALNQMFPDEFSLVVELLEEAGESDLDKDIMAELSQKSLYLVQIMKMYKVLVINTDHELYTELNTARIVVDLSDDPDLFTQISAISAGIPQINKIPSDYVKHNKNGLIITGNSELKKAINHFIDTLKYWQRAQAFSAEQIKKYSGSSLREYLLQITGEQSNG